MYFDILVTLMQCCLLGFVLYCGNTPTAAAMSGLVDVEAYVKLPIAC